MSADPLTPLQKWLWTKHRLRLTFRGEVMVDVMMLSSIIGAAYLVWVLLVAVTS